MFEIDIHVMSTNAGGAANVGCNADTAQSRAMHVTRFMVSSIRPERAYRSQRADVTQRICVEAGAASMTREVPRSALHRREHSPKLFSRGGSFRLKAREHTPHVRIVGKQRMTSGKQQQPLARNGREVRKQPQRLSGRVDVAA